jgi:uncharacterized membrane protein YeaQ/YmgE (transglycosylase-associated protein family)
MEELLRTLVGLLDDLAVAAVAGWVAGRVIGGKAPGVAASLICGILGWLIGRGLLAVLGGRLLRPAGASHHLPHRAVRGCGAVAVFAASETGLTKQKGAAEAAPSCAGLG